MKTLENTENIPLHHPASSFLKYNYVEKSVGLKLGMSVENFARGIREKYTFEKRFTGSFLEFLELPKRSFTILAGYKFSFIPSSHFHFHSHLLQLSFQNVYPSSEFVPLLHSSISNVWNQLAGGSMVNELLMFFRPGWGFIPPVGENKYELKSELYWKGFEIAWRTSSSYREFRALRVERERDSRFYSTELLGDELIHLLHSKGVEKWKNKSLKRPDSSAILLSQYLGDTFYDSDRVDRNEVRRVFSVNTLSLSRIEGSSEFYYSFFSGMKQWGLEKVTHVSSGNIIHFQAGVSSEKILPMPSREGLPSTRERFLFTVESNGSSFSFLLLQKQVQLISNIFLRRAEGDKDVFSSFTEIRQDFGFLESHKRVGFESLKLIELLKWGKPDAKVFSHLQPVERGLFSTIPEYSTGLFFISLSPQFLLSELSIRLSSSLNFSHDLIGNQMSHVMSSFLRDRGRDKERFTAQLVEAVSNMQISVLFGLPRREIPVDHLLNQLNRFNQFNLSSQLNLSNSLNLITGFKQSNEFKRLNLFYVLDRFNQIEHHEIEGLNLSLRTKFSEKEYSKIFEKVFTEIKGQDVLHSHMDEVFKRKKDVDVTNVFTSLKSRLSEKEYRKASERVITEIRGLDVFKSHSDEVFEFNGMDVTNVLSSLKPKLSKKEYKRVLERVITEIKRLDILQSQRDISIEFKDTDATNVFTSLRSKLSEKEYTSYLEKVITEIKKQDILQSLRDISIEFKDADVTNVFTSLRSRLSEKEYTSYLEKVITEIKKQDILQSQRDISIEFKDTDVTNVFTSLRSRLSEKEYTSYLEKVITEIKRLDILQSQRDISIDFKDTDVTNVLTSLRSKLSEKEYTSFVERLSAEIVSKNVLQSNEAFALHLIDVFGLHSEIETYAFKRFKDSSLSSTYSAFYSEFFEREIAAGYSWLTLENYYARYLKGGADAVTLKYTEAFTSSAYVLKGILESSTEYIGRSRQFFLTSVMGNEEIRSHVVRPVPHFYPEGSRVYYEGFRYAIPTVGLSIVHLEPETLLSKFITQFSTIQGLTSRLMRSSVEYVSEYIHSELVELYRTELSRMIHAQKETDILKKIDIQRDFESQQLMDVQKKYHTGRIFEEHQNTELKKVFDVSVFDAERKIEGHRKLNAEVMTGFRSDVLKGLTLPDVDILEPEILLAKFVRHFTWVQRVTTDLIECSNVFAREYMRKADEKRVVSILDGGKREVLLSLIRRRNDEAHLYWDWVARRYLHELSLHDGFSYDFSYVSMVSERNERYDRFNLFKGFESIEYLKSFERSELIRNKIIRNKVLSVGGEGTFILSGGKSFYGAKTFYEDGLLGAASLVYGSFFNAESAVLNSKHFSGFLTVRNVSEVMLRGSAELIREFEEMGVRWEWNKLKTDTSVNTLSLALNTLSPVSHEITTRIAGGDRTIRTVKTELRDGMRQLGVSSSVFYDKQWGKRLNEWVVERIGRAYVRSLDSHSNEVISLYHTGFRDAISLLDSSFSGVSGEKVLHLKETIGEVFDKSFMAMVSSLNALINTSFFESKIYEKTYETGIMKGGEGIRSYSEVFHGGQLDRYLRKEMWGAGNSFYSLFLRNGEAFFSGKIGSDGSSGIGKLYGANVLSNVFSFSDKKLFETRIKSSKEIVHAYSEVLREHAFERYMRKGMEVTSGLGNTLYFFLLRNDSQVKQAVESFGGSLGYWGNLIEQRENFRGVRGSDFEGRYWVEPGWDKFVRYLCEKQHYDELLKRREYFEGDSGSERIEDLTAAGVKGRIPVISRLDKSSLETKYRNVVKEESEFSMSNMKFLSMSLPAESWKAWKGEEQKEDDFFKRYFGKGGTSSGQSEFAGLGEKKEKVIDLWALAFGKPRQTEGEMFYYTPEMSVNYTETMERIENEVLNQTRQIKDEIENRIFKSTSSEVNMGQMADNVYELILDRIKRESRIRGY